MEVIVVIALLVVNIPIYKIIFRLVFKDVDDFNESVKYSFTPDIFSLIKRRFWKDQFGELKLSFFIFLVFMLILTEYIFIITIIKSVVQ